MLAPASNRQIAAPQTMQQTVLPAPIGGMDARIGVAADNMSVCLWAINILPVEYGMRVRDGYREWQIGMPSEVRTIIPYEGLVQTGADDKIFAVCAEGIYDVSIQSGTPVQKLAFSNTGADSGWGVYTHYIDASGDDLIYYADEGNGLFIYTPATDTWAQATGIVPSPDAITTFNIEDIVFIVSHKLRLWFITRDDNKAWYLPVNSYIGEANEFFFGAKFKHGGDLVGLYNWTVDGGAGRDDHLVAVSRGGDVLPYTGDDPSADTTWENTGVFFIGQVPLGKRNASQYGGELFLLSAHGVTSMSDLTSGAEPEDPNRSQLGGKIGRLLTDDMQNLIGQRGWAIKFFAYEGMFIISTPLRSDGTYRQYVMNTTTYGWGLWRDIPFVCSEAFKGDLLIGDPNGRVLRMDSDSDNIPAAGGAGEDIKWFILTSFTTGGAPALNKRVKFIRPNFSVTESAPSTNVYALYNYYTVEPAMPITGPGSISGDVWDTAKWDEAVWSSTQTLPFNRIDGAWGIGTVFAVATTGRSRGQTLLASWDVSWDVGGFL
jgi:hypothetical protein